MQVFVGDLLVAEDVKRAAEGIDYIYFTFAVQDGLLEATTIAAIAAQEAGLSSHALLLSNVSFLQASGTGIRDMLESCIYSSTGKAMCICFIMMTTLLHRDSI